MEPKNSLKLCLQALARKSAIDRAIAASSRHGRPINPAEARLIKRLIIGRRYWLRSQGVKP